MQVTQAYRYELDPSIKQRTALRKHAGAGRFAYNWGLARRIERFEQNEGKDRFTDAVEQHREWNTWKKENAPWWNEVSKCAPQESLRDLDKAFSNLRRGRKNGQSIGFPNFKRKGVRDSFRLTGAISVLPRSIQLPRLGKIRVKERTDKFRGRILSATVSREADRWYVSLTVKRERSDPKPINGPVVGLDLGIRTFAVVSDGTEFASPKPLQCALKRLKRRGRQHSRKEKGSKNRRKSALRLARLHRKIRNKRRDFFHKVTSRLTKTKSVIVVEDLAVRNMVRNHCLARAIVDASWSEFRRMLEYKAVWYGSKILVADRFYPSSKTCSNCDTVKKELDLSQRIFMCPRCGFSMDRDRNAAQNLENLCTASSAGTYACGDRRWPVAEAGISNVAHLSTN